MSDPTEPSEPTSDPQNIEDELDAALAALLEHVRLDMLQLHGRETPKGVIAVKRRYGLPVMKALSISTAADLEKIEPYRGIADGFLFDAKPPAGSQLPGGNGVSFDWTLLAGLSRDTDYLLSGGINAANVGAALRLAAPTGIDVSSGVESAPGIKDTSLIAGFFRAVRQARSQSVA